VISSSGWAEEKGVISTYFSRGMGIQFSESRSLL